MMTRIYILMLISFSTLCLSCGGKKVLGKASFEKWMKNKENGLAKEKTINRLRFKVSYQPMEWLMLKSNDQQLTNDSVNKLKSDYANVMTFALDITDTSGNNSMLRFELAHENEYYDRI